LSDKQLLSEAAILTDNSQAIHYYKLNHYFNKVHRCDDKSIPPTVAACLWSDNINISTKYCLVITPRNEYKISAWKYIYIYIYIYIRPLHWPCIARYELSLPAQTFRVVSLNLTTGIILYSFCVYRSALNKSRNASFHHYITSLAPDGQSIWKATKKFKRPTVAIPPIRKTDGNWARTDTEKACAFADYLANVFTLFPANSFEDELRTKAFLEAPCLPDPPLKLFHQKRKNKR
jgi:hypothetical protein